MIEIKDVTGKVLYSSETHTVLSACLIEAVGKGANLTDAYLRGANLWGANLWGANLRGANLWGANLWGANLTGANLWGANLRGANLRDAYLRDADLRDADLTGAKCLHYTILPEGDLIGYKKLKGGTIAKLLIPAKAKRVNFIGSRKCRAEYVKVLDGSGESLGRNSDDGQVLQYKKGRIVKCVHKFNADPRLECESGIHFFITKQEAIEFN
jgi:hypothetical protein